MAMAKAAGRRPLYYSAAKTIVELIVKYKSFGIWANPDIQNRYVDEIREHNPVSCRDCIKTHGARRSGHALFCTTMHVMLNHEFKA
jgi:hypothetical protein